MGSACSSDSQEKQSKKRDRALEHELVEAKRQDRAEKKLLLLGSGNSGKSTFFKQLVNIHGDGFTEKNLSDATKSVYDSVLTQMKYVIQSARDKKYRLSRDSEDSIKFIEELPRDIEINEAIAGHIAVLWMDESIRQAYHNRSNLSIVDSAPYFFDSIERIGKVGYKPNETDMLLVRTPTTGITEVGFDINGHSFKIFDVGGQRSERSKWIHSFDSVTAVLFVASLSCYDQSLFEDESVNAMTEALILFEETCNSRWFRKTAMILFLNKSDLFAQKIQQKPLSVCFEEYDGPEEGDLAYSQAIDYIRTKFIEQNSQASTRQVYSHVTCATNREDVSRVFNDVQHIVVNNSLQRGGLL